MQNLFKIAAIFTAIYTESSKAMNAAIMARKVEVLALFVELRKEFDAALTDSKLMEAFAEAMAETATGTKTLKEMKAEIQKALGLEAGKTQEVKKANLEETVKDLEQELAFAKSELDAMQSPEAKA
jgi:hypothetical protein